MLNICFGWYRSYLSILNNAMMYRISSRVACDYERAFVDDKECVKTINTAWYWEIINICIYYIIIYIYYIHMLPSSN